MAFAFDIGFLGGGQLARMSIMAAQRMGLQCLSLDQAANTPASQISDAVQGSLTDPESLAAIFAQCAVVTLENEFVPAKAIRKAMQLSGRPTETLVPNLEALAIIQDKFLQRQTLAKAGVPGPKAAPLDDDGSLAVTKIGFPMVLKSRFGGYDGKGVRVANNNEDLEQLSHLWASGGQWMAEEFVDFKRELAVIVFVDGARAGAFPTMETVQKDHVCDLVFPADIDASQVATQAVQAVGGKGLFGVELFESKTGELLVNELAPRPHNTGHYTLDWGGVSQFDQHIRLTLGLPPAPLDGVEAAMANLIGQAGPMNWRRGLVAAVAADPPVRVHWYGKEESRPGRKMGHINACGPNALERVKGARDLFYKEAFGLVAQLDDPG